MFSSPRNRPGPWLNDDPLVAVDRHHDVDLSADQDEEVVGDVALPVEVLPLADLAPDPQLVTSAMSAASSVGVASSSSPMVRNLRFYAAHPEGRILVRGGERTTLEPIHVQMESGLYGPQPAPLFEVPGKIGGSTNAGTYLDVVATGFSIPRHVFRHRLPHLGSDRRVLVEGRILPSEAVIDTGYDFFICHASEDKADVAWPLAGELTSRGFSVWYANLF